MANQRQAKALGLEAACVDRRRSQADHSLPSTFVRHPTNTQFNRRACCLYASRNIAGEIGYQLDKPDAIIIITNWLKAPATLLTDIYTTLTNHNHAKTKQKKGTPSHIAHTGSAISEQAAALGGVVVGAEHKLVVGRRLVEGPEANLVQTELKPGTHLLQRNVGRKLALAIVVVVCGQARNLNDWVSGRTAWLLSGWSKVDRRAVIAHKGLGTQMTTPRFGNTNDDTTKTAYHPRCPSHRRHQCAGDDARGETPCCGCTGGGGRRCSPTG